MPLGLSYSVNTDYTLYFDTEADLLAFIDGVTLGTVAQAADTSNSFIWNGTAWKSLNATAVYSGNGAPSSSLGANGDIYIDFDTGNFYEKVAGAWVVQGDITPTIPPDSWLYGTTTAATADGNLSNFYSEYVNNRVYQKGGTPSTLTFSNVIAESTSSTPTAFQTVNAITAISSRLYLAYVWGQQSGGTAPNILSVTGGPSWSLVKTATVAEVSNRAMRLSVYSAMSTSSIAGATLGIATDSSGVTEVHVTEVTGADTSGTNGSGAIVQSKSNTTTGANSLTVNLSAFADTTNNGTFYGVGTPNTVGSITAEAGHTKLADTAVSAVSGWEVETQWKLGQDTTPSATWGTAGASVAIALEIKPTLTAGSWTRLVPGLKVYQANFSVASTSAATNIFNQSIPGGLLENNSAIVILVPALYTNNTAANRTLTLTVSFGGVNVWGDLSGNISSNATARGFEWVMYMVNLGSSTSRRMSGHVRLGDATSGTIAGNGKLATESVNPDYFNTTISGASTVDTSSAQTLTLTVTHSTNSASLSLVGAVTVVVVP